MFSRKALPLFADGSKGKDKKIRGSPQEAPQSVKRRHATGCKDYSPPSTYQRPLSLSLRKASVSTPCRPSGKVQRTGTYQPA
jgi:hypothetical protein